MARWQRSAARERNCGPPEEALLRAEGLPPPPASYFGARLRYYREESSAFLPSR